MLTIISPAKTLDFESPVLTKKSSMPTMLERSAQLAGIMKGKTAKDLQKMMKISPKLAELNVERFQSWQPDMTGPESRQALLAFKGDVYIGLKAEDLNQRDFTFAQNNLRILSGLYGLLRPLDLIRPYRLEMGIKLENPSGKDLYDFWRAAITRSLSDEFEGHKTRTLINLASNEYAKVLDWKELPCNVITPVFKDYSGGSYKVLSFFAKKARGAMANFVIKNRITKPTELKLFNHDGYVFDSNRSTDSQWVYLRKV